ncbi:MAG: hypothetical protein IJX18_00250, partial [Clostridia bacterium]|nr:hypothetical protein [Clostridia bacterium]
TADMYYNYHAKNMQRIEKGELVGVTPSEQEAFAFVLVFSSYPFTRPVRPHSVHKYERFFEAPIFKNFFKNQQNSTFLKMLEK